MTTIVQYKLVTGDTKYPTEADFIQSFTDNVNQHIKDGWQPIGSSFSGFYQAMVLYKDTDGKLHSDTQKGQSTQYQDD